MARIHRSLETEVADPETAALQSLARYLADRCPDIAVIAAYSGQEAAMLAHDVANEGSHLWLRVAALEDVPDAPDSADAVRFHIDFMIGCGSLERATAVSRAAALSWQLRGQLVHQLVGVPFLAEDWEYDSTAPWHETQSVNIKSMILKAVCHLRTWEEDIATNPVI